MTEAEWLASTEPKPMLEFLRVKVGDRKARLFAVACCRSIWPLPKDGRLRRAVEVAERYARQCLIQAALAPLTPVGASP